MARTRALQVIVYPASRSVLGRLLKDSAAPVLETLTLAGMLNRDRARGTRSGEQTIYRDDTTATRVEHYFNDIPLHVFALDQSNIVALIQCTSGGRET